MNKDDDYTKQLKSQLQRYRRETRCLEFKSNYQTAEKLGHYISALSNGACIEHQNYAYLYFGVDDTTLEVKGTTFDVSCVKAKGNQALELYLRQYVSPKINFTIEDFLYDGHTHVVRFKIPAAAGQPTTFMSQAYVRVDSHTTNLSPYVEWVRAIYMSQDDWTAHVIENATVDDLDPEALVKAREGFKDRFPDHKEEVDEWRDVTFLDRAGLTQEGQVTNAAMLLLGNKEKAYKLEHIAQISWICYQDGKKFGENYAIPFILNTDRIWSRIRNYRFKIYPRNSLIPAEVQKYESRSVLEAMYNCILHQDYVQNERIIVTEENDKLTFENAGGFYDGDYNEYIYGKKTPRRYRNPFLSNAMDNIKMIDAKGYGIYNMFLKQKERYLPLPDYDGTDDNHVVMHLPGNIIDENYSLLLMEHIEIGLTETVLLDQIQKGKTITEEAIDMLRKKHLIEGRRPHVFIAKGIAQNINHKVEYSKHKGLKDKSCEALLKQAFYDHRKLTRKEIDNLLFDVLPDQLDSVQRKNKISNILKKISKEGIIAVSGKGPRGTWYLKE